MKFSPLKKNVKECFLALDIGTEAVKALVFDKENQKYSIRGSALEYFDESRPFDNNKVISKVKEEAVIMSGGSPKGLFLGLPANILRSRVDFQVVYRKNPKEIIRQEEERIIRQRVFKETEKKISEHFARESGIMPQDIHFIDFEILEIKIDGYEISGLSGYGGKTLEFRILANFLPKDYFNKFSRMAGDLGFKLPKIANPFKNLVRIFGVSQGVFLDVGGEVTQICLVKNQKIDLINEFGRGGRDFDRAISEILGIKDADAKILKESYSQNELTEGVRKRIKEIFVSSCREWSIGFKSSLKAAKGMIPYNFLLLGGGSQLPEIKELVGGEGKEIKVVYPKDFENIIDNGRCPNTPQFVNSILLFYGQ